MSQIVNTGRLLLSPFVSIGTWYNNTAKAHPLATGIWTSGLKTSAADLFAQKVIEGKKEVDWNRHAVFCTFGFLYLGGFQYWLYNVKFTQWCGPLTKKFGHKATAPIKVFIDQAIHHPFIYFPTFYAIKAKVSGKPLSYAAEKYRSEIWQSVKALWGVWVPLQLINFAVVPRHMRVPYVAAVSFGWTMILSVMQGKFDAKRTEDAAERVQMASEASSKAAVESMKMPTASLLPGAAKVTAAQSMEHSMTTHTTK